MLLHGAQHADKWNVCGDPNPKSGVNGKQSKGNNFIVQNNFPRLH